MSGPKPALYYAVVRYGWNDYGGWKIFRVTSEKLDRVYGAFLDRPYSGTTVRYGDIKAKLDSEEKAKACLTMLKQKYESFGAEINAIEINLKRVKDNRETACNELVAAYKRGEFV